MTFWRARNLKPRRMWAIAGFVMLSLIGLTLWNYVDLRLLHVMPGHKGRVRDIAFTPDGKWLISADSSRIHVWDYAQGKLSNTLSVQCHALAIHPDSQSLVYADGDRVSWASLPGGELLHQLSLPSEVLNPGNQVSLVSLTRDGKRLVVGGGRRDYSGKSRDSGFIAVWDLTTRELVEPPRILSEFVGQCVISPDGSHVGYLAYPNRVFFRIGEQGETRSIDDGTDLCFTPDSTGLLIEQGSTMELLSVQNGQGRLVSDSSYSFRGSRLSFSPDGKFVARGGASLEFQLWHHGTTRLYTYPDFKLVTSYHSNEQRYGKGSFASSIAISPDGRFIAAGSSEGQVRIWKMPQ